MKKRLTVLAVSLMLTGDARAIQDPSQTTTPATTHQGSRPSSIPSNGADDSSLALHLSGTIVMADGSPMPPSIRVDLSCHGRTTRQTHASSDGHFRIELGSGGQIGAGLTDASASIPGNTSFGSSTAGQVYSNVSGRKLTRGLALGRVDLTGCQIQIKSIPGYKAEPIELGPVGKFEGDIGYIYLAPLAGVSGVTVRSKTLLAPRSAVKEYEKAKKELARKPGDHAKAAIRLQKALQAYPEFAEAWNLLAELRTEEKDFPGAREAFRKAIDIDPGFITPFLSIAQLELADNQWAEAVRWCDRIVELNAYLPQGQYLHALAHFQLQDFAVAEKSILALQRGGKEQQWPFIHFMMGAIMANRGDYAAAAGELARFLDRSLPPSAAPMMESARDQLTDWERRGLIPKP